MDRSYSLIDRGQHYELTFIVTQRSDTDIEALANESGLFALARKKDVSVRVARGQFSNDALNALFCLALEHPRVYIFQRGERVESWLGLVQLADAFEWDEQKGYHITDECWRRVQELAREKP